MASVTLSNPCCDSWRSTMSRMENSSPIGTSGLGSLVVYGRRRTPLPPARMTACMGFSLLVVDAWLVFGQVGGLPEPFDGFFQARVPGVQRLPSGALAELRRVRDQPLHFGVLGSDALRVFGDVDVLAHQPGDVSCRLADGDLFAGSCVERFADQRGARGGAD